MHPQEGFSPKTIEKPKPLELRVDLESLDDNPEAWKLEAERLATDLAEQIVGQQKDLSHSDYQKMGVISGFPGRNELRAPTTDAVIRSKALSQDLGKLVLSKLRERGVQAEITDNKKSKAIKSGTSVMLYQNIQDDLNTISRNPGAPTSSAQKSIWEYEVRRVLPQEISPSKEGLMRNLAAWARGKFGNILSHSPPATPSHARI